MFFPRLHRSRSLVFGRFALYSKRYSTPGSFIVYNLVVAALLPAFVFYSCVDGGITELRRLRQPDDDLYRLRRPPSTEELQRGLRRGAGRLRATDPLRLETWPFCRVTQNESRPGRKRNSNFTVTRWTRILDKGSILELSNGERVRLSTEVRILGAPSGRTLKCDAEDEARWRKLRPEIPGGGWLEQLCIQDGETLFVEGCLGPKTEQVRTLGPCPEGPLRVVLEGGSADVLISSAVESIAGGLGSLYWVLIAVLLYGWKLLHARPFVQNLIRRLRGTPSLPKRWIILAGVGSFFFFITRFGFSTASAMACCIAVAAAAVQRILVLGLMCRRIKTLPTTLLSNASGPLVKAAVRVSERAANRAGPLSSEPCAAFLLDIYDMQVRRVEPEGQKRAQMSWQSVLPIVDESGPGLVDLSDAALDLNMIWTVVGRIAVGNVAERAHALIEDRRLVPAGGHRAWVFEETRLSPGESLLIIGDASAVADPQREAGPPLPRFQHHANAPLIVHSGSERSLLFHLRREQIYLILMLSVMLLAGVMATLLTRHLEGLRRASPITLSNQSTESHKIAPC